MDTYFRTDCPSCKKPQIFYGGNDEDCTSYAPEAGLCYSCGTSWLFDEEESKLRYGDDVQPIDVNIEIGCRIVRDKGEIFNG